MKVNLIAAVSQNGVIGVDGRLPWNIPADLKRFKELTVGKAVIMGRKTYESIGRPLPNRFNVVITSDKKLLRDARVQDLRIIFVPSLKDALQVCRVLQFGEVFIIGGSSVYKEALDTDIVDNIYLTRVHQDFEGDAYFPYNVIDYHLWEVTSLNNKTIRGDFFDYSFINYERKR